MRRVDQKMGSNSKQPNVGNKSSESESKINYAYAIAENALPKKWENPHAIFTNVNPFKTFKPEKKKIISLPTTGYFSSLKNNKFDCTIGKKCKICGKILPTSTLLFCDFHKSLPVKDNPKDIVFPDKAAFNLEKDSATSMIDYEKSICNILKNAKNKKCKICSQYLDLPGSIICRRCSKPVNIQTHKEYLILPKGSATKTNISQFEKTQSYSSFHKFNLCHMPPVETLKQIPTLNRSLPLYFVSSKSGRVTNDIKFDPCPSFNITNTGSLTNGENQYNFLQNLKQSKICSDELCELLTDGIDVEPRSPPKPTPPPNLISLLPLTSDVLSESESSSSEFDEKQDYIYYNFKRSKMHPDKVNNTLLINESDIQIRTPPKQNSFLLQPPVPEASCSESVKSFSKFDAQSFHTIHTHTPIHDLQLDHAYKLKQDSAVHSNMSFPVKTFCDSSAKTILSSTSAIEEQKKFGNGIEKSQKHSVHHTQLDDKFDIHQTSHFNDSSHLIESQKPVNYYLQKSRDIMETSLNIKQRSIDIKQTSPLNSFLLQPSVPDISSGSVTRFNELDAQSYQSFHATNEHTSVHDSQLDYAYKQEQDNSFHFSGIDSPVHANMSFPVKTFFDSGAKKFFDSTTFEEHKRFGGDTARCQKPSVHHTELDDKSDIYQTRHFKDCSHLYEYPKPANYYLRKSIDIMEEIDRVKSETIDPEKILKDLKKNKPLMKVIDKLASRKLNFPRHFKTFKDLPSK